MSRKMLHGLLTAAGLSLLLASSAGLAQVQPEIGYFGTCTAGNSCSIETVLSSGADLCNDGVDNDGNGYCDAGGCSGMAAEPHCQSEVLCQDGADNDGDSLTDGDDLDCRCIRVAASLPGGNVCTANDITVSYSAQPVVSDGCINSTDYVVAQLFADITVKPERYDLGMWISLDGNDGVDGTVCTRQMLQPVAVSPTVPDPINPLGTGPFNDLDGDRCGDREASLNAVYKFPFRVNVPCTDFILSPGGQAGFVDLGQCGSWAQPGGNPVCSNPGGVVPGTSSKCNCSRGDTGVPGPNFEMDCTALPASGPLVPGGAAQSFTIEYSNVITAGPCTPGAPTDTFGRNRCGTVSYVQLVVDYGSAGSHGTFYYVDSSDSDAVIPSCATPGQITSSDVGVVCNDGTQLIFVPRDTISPDALGVVTPTATQSLVFKYALNASDTTAPTFFVNTFWNGDLNTVVDATISPTEAVDLTSSIEQVCTGCTCNTTATATPITLAYFRAASAGRAVRFDWSTETEAGNVGFNLYAEVGGRRVRLNDEPIPTQASDSLEPQSYSADFPVPDGAKKFYIEDLDLHGRAKSHGPFAQGKSYGVVLSAPHVDWAAVRREQGLSVRESPRTIRSRAGDRGFVASAPAGGSGAATLAVPVELFVDRTGLYRITYEQLLDAGFDFARENASQLGLDVDGVQVPIYLVSGSKFGPGGYFEFWGEALDTLYTKTNVYRLRTGARKPARAAVSTAIAAGSAAPSYLATRSFERNRAYALWSSASEPFYDTQMLTFTSVREWQFGFSIDRLAASPTPATLNVGLYGGSSFDNVAPDHHLEISVNGVQLGEATFDGPSELSFEADLPVGTLVEGLNTLTIRLPGDTGAIYDLVDLDKFSVTYPRTFVAEAPGALDFTGSGSRFDVTDLPTASVVAYRRDGPALTRLSGVSVAPGAGAFVATVPGSGTSASYSVASGSGLLTPSEIRAGRQVVDIRSGSATYLVISHAAFLDGIQPLAAARAAQGYSVKVVDVEDVYSQFSGGIFDARAIQEYVAFAYSNLGTRYVLLVGGDTYDYFDYLGRGSVSFVPSLYRQTGDIIHFAPSDASYADVDEDGIPDLAIGRLPVRTPLELDGLVEKTLQYEARAYLGGGTYAADYADSTANESFKSASDRLITKLPSSWSKSRIYLDDMPLADARAQLFSDLAAGANLTSYVGHSGISSWGSSLRPVNQHLFTVNDVALLNNSGRPTLVTQLGCWNAYYPSPVTESLGNRFTLTADRGAAAVLGSATLTEDSNGNRFGALLTPMLARPGVTVGDAILAAKREFAATARPGTDLRDVLLGWIELGDPALQVAP